MKNNILLKKDDTLDTPLKKCQRWFFQWVTEEIGKQLCIVEKYNVNKCYENICIYNDINTGWDGKYKGKPVKSGVYVYLLSVEFADGNTIEQKGNITLLR